MVMSRDLDVNRQLLDTRFQGYKLDSQPLLLHSKDITGIDIVPPSDEKYSFIQLREFSLHNHLHSDPWNSNSIYLINSAKQIVKIVYNCGNKGDSVLEGPTKVWDLPSTSLNLNYHFNVTLRFASPLLAVASDGAGNVFIISTGDRKSFSESWKEIYCESILAGGRLADARISDLGNLLVLFCHVDTKQSYINCLQFSNEGNGVWKRDCSTEFSGKGSLDYAAFGSDNDSVIIIGQIEIKIPEEKSEKKDLPNPSQDTGKELAYEWQQNFEEIKVWIEVADGNPSVTISSTSLLVKSQNGRTLLQGKLHRPVEDGLSVWEFIERDGLRTLEIVISKMDEGTMWPSLFESSHFRGKEVLGNEVVNEIHNRLAHLTSETEDVGGATVLNSGQLEECDISDGEGRTFIRFDLSSSPNLPAIKVDLGNGQWLMSGTKSPESPPYFCLRFDVDGLVYDVNEGSPKHLATFCAFGFVQASKTSRVFTFMPHDLSYCGLVDADGRVYIYREGSRPCDKKEWGSQFIISLEKKKIHGVHPTPTHLFILSDNYLNLIEIKKS